MYSYYLVLSFFRHLLLHRHFFKLNIDEMLSKHNLHDHLGNEAFILTALFHIIVTRVIRQ